MAKSSKTTESAGSKSTAKSSATTPSPGHGASGRAGTGGAKASAKAPSSSDEAARGRKETGKSAGGKGAAGTRAGGGLAQPVQPSEQLAVVVGKEPLPRAMIVKKMWDYIKSHDLQNPKNKREILADDTLEPIFGKAKVSMFEMNSHIARHVK